MWGMTMLPLSAGALGCGILFGLFNTASARNPEETDKLFGNTLVAFALIETFIFLSLVVAIAVSFAL